ncbi:MAG: sialate O-acetylesterase, partial [Clostridiales bacterium]|nr:sialate O-acetylesterase [Clostridiales bacterium]
MFKVAAIFSDNMVLQRNKNIKIFGEGDCQSITVMFNGIKVETDVIGGKWTCILPAMEASDGLTLNVSDGINTISFSNVSIGEVWLAGGQSNMELELRYAKDSNEYLSELNPNIPVRFYYTNKVKTVEQAIEAEKHSCWGVCDPEGSKAWSAVGFHFAKKLSSELGVTVGIIGCNWGGTSASSWMSREYLSCDNETNSYLEEYADKTAGKTEQELISDYKDYEEYEKKFNENMAKCYAEKPDSTWDEIIEKCGESNWPGPMAPNNPYRPCGLYETMLKRVCPYTMKGFLYYQGESDDHKPNIYYKMLTKLIDCWRTDWEDYSMHFEIVQLPMFKYKHDEDFKHWCLIREAQMKAFTTIKNTGIAVISDCGELDNIHPIDKVPVGERLALQALVGAYNKEYNAFGPIFKSVYFLGNIAELSFDYAEKGFIINGENATGFEVAGSDKKFFDADAVMVQDKIYLSSVSVSKPVYVRYDWRNYIEPSVFCSETKIPLAPFRTS